MPRPRPSTAASPTRIARTSISARSTRTRRDSAWRQRTTTVLQVSAGRLNDAEREAGLPPTRRDAGHRIRDVPPCAQSIHAVGVHHRLGDERRAARHDARAARRVRVSSRDRHVGFLRFEVVGKPAHDLHVHESTDIFTVGKIQLGYTYYLRPGSRAADRDGRKRRRKPRARSVWRPDMGDELRQAWRCS